MSAGVTRRTPVPDIPEFRELSDDQKYRPLTSSDLSIRPEEEFLDVISRQAAKLATSSADFRVLDFGCGRGTTAGRMRTAGWGAFGVDIEPQFIEAGAIVNALADGNFPILSLLNAMGQSVFPDEYFDAVISDQLLEHVADLDQVAREISRVLKPGGITFHRFPARFRPIEPHYGLPFVHWLPKDNRRRKAINALLAVGAPVPLPRAFSRERKAEIIFEYSCRRTFYRSRREIERSFLDAQIPLDFDSMWVRLCEKRLRRHGAPRQLAGQLAKGPGVSLVLNTFHGHRALGYKISRPNARQ